MRSLAELTTTDEPAWPWIQEQVARAPSAQLLPVDPVRADAALLKMQITMRSPLGALVHGSGGLLIDGGWLRLLGSGTARGCREAEVETLGGDHAFAIYPFLWAEGPAIGERMRRPVPITETCASALDMRRQLGE